MNELVITLNAQQCDAISRGLAHRIIFGLELLKHPKCLDSDFWHAQIALCEELRAQLPAPLPRKPKARA